MQMQSNPVYSHNQCHHAPSPPGKVMEQRCQQGKMQLVVELALRQMGTIDLLRPRPLIMKLAFRVPDGFAQSPGFPGETIETTRAGLEHLTVAPEWRLHCHQSFDVCQRSL